jgi:hypothetical protein
MLEARHGSSLVAECAGPHTLAGAGRVALLNRDTTASSCLAKRRCRRRNHTARRADRSLAIVPMLTRLGCRGYLEILRSRTSELKSHELVMPCPKMNRCTTTALGGLKWHAACCPHVRICLIWAMEAGHDCSTLCA